MNIWAIAGMLCALQAHVHAQEGKNTFVCVDGYGRTLTSDRLIRECWDRPQRVLSPSGVQIRIVQPARSEGELARIEEARQREDERRQKQEDAQQQDRLLLMRYPDRATHDETREKTLSPIRKLLSDASQHLDDLQSERDELEDEINDAGTRGGRAKSLRELDLRKENLDTDIQLQRRFIEVQKQRYQRAENQFDVELNRLNKLWAQH